MDVLGPEGGEYFQTLNTQLIALNAMSPVAKAKVIEKNMEWRPGVRELEYDPMPSGAEPKVLSAEKTSDGAFWFPTYVGDEVGALISISGVEWTARQTTPGE